MPQIRISIFRVMLLAQLLLLVGLLLPGILTALTSAPTTENHEQFSAITPDRPGELLFTSFKTPAQLIDYLHYHYRDGTTLVELRSPDGTLFFEHRGSSTVTDTTVSWLHATFVPFVRAFIPSQSPTSEPRHFTQGSLKDWTLRIVDPETLAAENRLPQLSIGFEALVASMFILVMLSILGTRVLSRPLDEVDEQLRGIRDRTRRQLKLPNNSPAELDRLLVNIEGCISEQQSILTEAGYSSSLMQQVFENLDSPVLILDSEGTLRFSNASGRRHFNLGTHPNAWTYIEFVQRPEVVEALGQSLETHNSILLPKLKGLPKRTSLRALIRGNESPWLLFTVRKKSDHLKAIGRENEAIEAPSPASSTQAPSPQLIQLKASPSASRGNK